MVLDDRLGRRHWRVHAGVRVRHKHRLQAQLCCRAAGRVDAVLGLHSGDDQLIDPGRGLVVGAFVVGQAVQDLQAVGQGTGRAFAVFDEVAAFLLPRAVAGGNHVLLGEPATDGVVLLSSFSIFAHFFV